LEEACGASERPLRGEQMKRTKEVRPWVDKLIDNSLGGAGLSGDNKLFLMALLPASPSQREQTVRLVSGR
jgi:hypothetical protein